MQVLYFEPTAPPNNTLYDALSFIVGDTLLSQVALGEILMAGALENRLHPAMSDAPCYYNSTPMLSILPCMPVVARNKRHHGLHTSAPN